jgi:hypothetical protein
VKREKTKEKKAEDNLSQRRKGAKLLFDILCCPRLGRLQTGNKE